ncbi:MAG TPA: CCA tRNA nucleotidyltransferase [Lacipirellulaceae bacterium]|nr:CCA tRNA nucleotidyltransferase [Lacipirellulaceae bacterium]
MPAAPNQREFALDVVRRLRAAGHEALWAGGCVRDSLLGAPPKDYDVATSARPDAVRELFGPRRTLAIGASFGVITVLGGKPLEPIEVATFRTDGVYRDGRRPQSVAYSDAQHDAQRRDFTINGLFYDPLSEQVVDYVGGVADLEARLVRAIGDPARRFAEDKLRMLRAVRFTAALEFELDPQTLAAIRAMAGEVQAVSAERIGGELRRILAHRSRLRGVSLLAEAALLAPVLPEVGEHADRGDDAWHASLARLSRLAAEASFPLALACLVAGLVEPERAGRLGRRLRLSNREIDHAVWLVRQLPALREAALLPWPRLQRLLAHEHGRELVELAAADAATDDPGIARCRAVLAEPPSQWNPPPVVTGDDLIAAGIGAGRHFAELLEHLRDEQLEGRAATREAALAAARAWLQGRGRG